MIADWIQKFIAENTMDGYMGEPAVGVEKVLELVAKVEAEALQSAVTHLLEKAAKNHERCNYTAESAYRDAAYAVNALALPGTTKESL